MTDMAVWVPTRWYSEEGGVAAERVVIVRRTILEILRAAGEPLSTPEIRRRLGGGDRSKRPHQGASCSFSGECTPRWCWCWHVAAYRQLRYLEQVGLAERVFVCAATRMIYWRFVDTESDDHFNAALEAMDSDR